MGAVYIVLGLLFVLVWVAIGFCIVIIKQSETMVIERLGKFHKVLDSGISFLIPFCDKPRKIEWKRIITAPNNQKYIRLEFIERLDLRENVYDFPEQSVITKDNVVLQINALLYFQITDPFKVVYEIGNLPEAIEKLTQTTLRNIIGDMMLDETLTSRDTINHKLRAILDDATDKWGVKVNRVELMDIMPPRDIRDAMEKQMRAERDRRAAILTAEAEKQSAILCAEGARSAEITRAEGAKQSKILYAEGEAQARIRVAEAEAEAIRKVTEAITAANKGDPAAYLIAMKYIEAFKEMASGKDGKLVYLPYESAGVMSSIGSIKDLFQKKD